MSARIVSSGRVLNAKREIYTAMLELYPDGDPAVIDEDVADAVRSYAGLDRGHRRGGVDIKSVLEWLRHPEQHSPWVDWLAIKKAESWDPKALDGLSMLEWEVIRFQTALQPAATWRLAPGEGIEHATNPDLFRKWDALPADYQWRIEQMRRRARDAMKLPPEDEFVPWARPAAGGTREGDDR